MIRFVLLKIFVLADQQLFLQVGDLQRFTIDVDWKHAVRITVLQSPSIGWR